MAHTVLRYAAAWFAVAVTASPSAARAEEEGGRAVNLDKPAERRSGLVLGLMGGFGVGGSSGYPNSAQVIDNPAYYSASGLMTSNGGSFLLMGALTDYLNFGFFFGGGSANNSDWRESGGGAGLRVEAFPLYSLVPALRDLGIETQFGIGSAKLDAKFRPNAGADGAESLLGVGVFYEWSFFRFLGGHFAGGPSLEYDAIATRSIEAHWALLGGRIVFYGGP